MTSIKIFDKLYCLDSKGKQKWWQIRVESIENNGKIITEYGYISGKTTKNEQIVTSGKNIGKKNETTPFQQAVSQAQSKYNKKIKDGFTKSDPIKSVKESEITSKKPLKETEGAVKESETNEKESETTEIENYKPMLAHDYHKRGHDIAFPCYYQPKLDGVRAVIYYVSKENEGNERNGNEGNGNEGNGNERKGQVLIQTRSGDYYPHFDELRESLEVFFKENPEIVLDGELYTNEMTFEELTGLCRKKTKKKEHFDKLKLIKFHIFDLYDKKNPLLSFEERHSLLLSFNTFDKNFIELVETGKLESEKEMKDKFNELMKKGYEGIMMRNKLGAYKIKHRSKDLQKYKEFKDSEYKIVNFIEGTGIHKGMIIYVCEYESKKGTKKNFKVNPNGTHDTRKEMYNLAKKNPETVIGKMLTVKYQELTSDLCPRFPVGLTIRDYE